MTYQNFLTELRKTSRNWEIDRWPDACHGIRLACHSPLTAISMSVAKRKRELAVPWGLEDYDLAADDIGMDHKLAEKISKASDFSMKNLESQELRKIRHDLLTATGLSRKKKSPAN